jgi:hypothetical protein
MTHGPGRLGCRGSMLRLDERHNMTALTAKQFIDKWSRIRVGEMVAGGDKGTG